MMATAVKNIVRPYAAEILGIQKETEHEWTFRLKSDAKVAHGQFMQLSIPKIGEAPISVSGQGDGWLEFTLRAVGKVTDEIFRKEVGDILFIRGPYGHGWPMEELRGKHLVVVSGGTGIAPVRSLLRLAETEESPFIDVTLVSGFKDHTGIVFKDDLARWEKNPKFKTIYTLDNEEMGPWHKGFVTNYCVNIGLQNFGDNYAILVVGPPPMMHFTGLKLIECGAKVDHIWMSFERKMQCGVGKCGNCRIDETYVCLDGPVFPYAKAKYLVD
ncbi:anaerobic sulfite reductase subunit AsrB [Peptoniphilaceae bacterium SGI.137]|nr:anaerobic sulfite reductase subunit AsrB [Peptoniphilaceae bacterium]MCI6660299.1 anaerobic sulfite reductase subunit AsrB [Peptoniphilaceae bacterium]MDY4196457.1 anaerobic sulfite reductase subunit AsrB [Peptoniphilaceae bacterium]MDY5841495.1 anaerobic sulfite reductase subunit AsrB [Peptoniphilaceae bacterium]MDY6147149.1 anaerobic sulfite reductase subunit AsrB [Peptoniphilaceae bacterium]